MNNHSILVKRMQYIFHEVVEQQKPVKLVCHEEDEKLFEFYYLLISDIYAEVKHSQALTIQGLINFIGLVEKGHSSIITNSIPDSSLAAVEFLLVGQQYIRQLELSLAKVDVEPDYHESFKTYSLLEVPQFFLTELLFVCSTLSLYYDCMKDNTCENAVRLFMRVYRLKCLLIEIRVSLSMNTQSDNAETMIEYHSLISKLVADSLQEVKELARLRRNRVIVNSR